MTKAAKTSRNDPCTCGSGLKYKRCCGASVGGEDDNAGRFFSIAAVLAGLMLVVGVGAMARSLFFGDEGPKKVWSAEHGHYHTVGGQGEGGPGRVWNEAHGHYHDVAKDGSSMEPVAAPNPGALEGLRAAELEAAKQKAAGAAAGH
jgi:hypothetical protein